MLILTAKVSLLISSICVIIYIYIDNSENAKKKKVIFYVSQERYRYLELSNNYTPLIRVHNINYYCVDLPSIKYSLVFYKY